MLSDFVNNREAAAWFTGAAFAKAMDYRAQGRVMGLAVSEDLTSIRAHVGGSGKAIYDVDITLEFDHLGVDVIDGQCSCPMEHNCKHVAATLLEVLARERATKKPIPAAPSAQTVGAPAAALSMSAVAWLEELGKASRGDDYPPEVAQRLLYLLRPMAAGQQMAELAVSLVSVRQLKAGGFSSSATKTRPSAFNANAEPPKYYRDADIDIVTGLSRRYIYSSLQDADPVRSIDLLQRMVATGRAYWCDYERSPLAWGEARDGRVEWRLAGTAGVTPHLIVDGAIAMNAEPPVYVDAEAGLIGSVELGLPPRLAHRLLAAPVIRPAEVALVVSGLNAKLPGIRPDLLPAAPEPAQKITADPTPVLRLGLGRTMVFNYYGARPSGAEPIPVASLGFLYGPIELDPAEKAARIEAAHEGRLYEVTRRPAREKAAAKALKELGFLPARAVQPFLDTKHQNDIALPTATDWIRFLHLDAPILREQGFEIRIGDDFPYRLAQSSGVFDAELESSGIDWFELGLGIDIDGERYDLAPALAGFVSGPGFDSAAFESLLETDQHFYLSLPDGRVLALAAARFVPLLLALHTVSLNGLSLDKNGKLRLSRAETLPMLDHESEHFAFKGADNLRHLASLLQQGDRAEPVLPPWFGAVLRPYQADGVAWLDMLRESGLGGVLADDMGLGKTVQLLALFALEKARGRTGPSLVVAPTSLMGNWLNEAKRFAPELKVLLLHGADRKQVFDTIADHDVVLTTYPLIARDHATLLAQDWHMAVLDEAQTIKNPNAATTRWLAGIKANHRFCLTGTPMENHLGELWSVMSFVNPGFLGDKTAFGRNWRTPIEKRGDPVRSRRLRQRVKPFMLRRTKTEVATELPEKIEIAESIVIEGKQRDLYDSIRLAMSEKVRAAIKERGLAKSHIIVLEALLRLRQACCDPRLLKLDDKVDRPSAKLARLMEMVTELLSEGRKIIVFSQFTSMLALIEERFEAAQIRYSLLTGDTKDRAGAIDRFQQGATDVFLISLKAGGVGLNLTAADTVIIFDPWWNPAVEAQAIDRAHRLGQDKAVFVYRLVTAGTIEEKMDELKARKQALADSLFERDGEIGSALTEEDVAALFEG